MPGIAHVTSPKMFGERFGEKNEQWVSCYKYPSLYFNNYNGCDNVGGVGSVVLLVYWSRSSVSLVTSSKLPASHERVESIDD